MDLLVRNIGRLLPMRTTPDEVIEDAAVYIRDESVVWLGRRRDLPADINAGQELDAEGRVVVPGFVDPHTHLIWAGTRREEFVARLAGQPYDGGGINTTVSSTRAASDDELFASAVERGRRMLGHGTTTVEIKTGYGLTPNDELRCLDVIGRLDEALPWRVQATYLGAHAVPDGRDRAEYVAEVIRTLPDALARGASWVDVFCDVGVFTVAETRAILLAARDLGLPGRLHAEEIGHTGAADLAAELGCASADHLEHVTPDGARAMAGAGVVGVLLPTVTLSLRTFAFGQYDVLREAGVQLALSTDCNPGTSWCESMPYVVQLACLAYGMRVDEALWAATRGGAASLRVEDAGRIDLGVRGDLAVLDTDHEADLIAHLGAADCWQTVVAGTVWS
ncbi:MAG TPA: imidazolonepropionase [Actinomycetes bacterium]|nr:imidazolonepropionase [Actinomycetes bacterium]